MRNATAFVLGVLLAAFLAFDPFQAPADFSLDPFVRIQTSDGEFVGSGTIVYSRDGETFVLTAGHVAECLEHWSALVEVFQHDPVDGRLIGSRNITGCVWANIWEGVLNERTDLALIKLDSTDTFSVVAIHAGPVSRLVTCVSAPAGAIPTPALGQVVRSDFNGVMQASPFIFPGSSGGALCVRTCRGWELCGVAVQAWRNGMFTVGYVSMYVKQEDVREFLASHGIIE
jgi:hypothetical protein